MKKILTLMILVFGLVGFIGCSNPINVDYDELPKVEQEAPQVVEPVEDVKLHYSEYSGYGKCDFNIYATKKNDEINIDCVFWGGTELALTEGSENVYSHYRHSTNSEYQEFETLDVKCKILEVNEDCIKVQWDLYFAYAFKPEYVHLCGKGKEVVLKDKIVYVSFKDNEVKK